MVGAGTSGEGGPASCRVTTEQYLETLECCHHPFG